MTDPDGGTPQRPENPGDPGSAAAASDAVPAAPGQAAPKSPLIVRVTSIVSIAAVIAAGIVLLATDRESPVRLWVYIAAAVLIALNFVVSIRWFLRVRRETAALVAAKDGPGAHGS